jgi:hypothetical protein
VRPASGSFRACFRRRGSTCWSRRRLPVFSACASGRTAACSGTSWSGCASRSCCSCSTIASTSSTSAPDLQRTSCAPCPELRLLAASRDPLGVPGERVFRTGSLTVSARNDPPDAIADADADAVILFCDRATAVLDHFKLEDITALLLLTDEDDFNALVATMLTAGGVDGPIYRIAPPPGTHGVVHSFTAGEVLFGTGLSRDAIGRRYRHGAKILAQRGDGSPSPDHDLLFRIRTDGQLVPVLNGRAPRAEATDIAVLLGPGQLDAPSPSVVPLERAPGP